jgi:hypothetical protein
MGSDCDKSEKYCDGILILLIYWIFCMQENTVVSESLPHSNVSNECPYCGTPMAVTEMACGGCHVSITAEFPMSRIAGLPVEHQRFIEMFLLAGGNLKEIAEQVGVSYPTIRSRLDKVIEALRGEIAKTQRVRGNLLDAIEPGKTTAESAARLIKRI